MLGHSTNLDISSPSKSYQDVHGDLDQYLDCSLSETHSSVTSPVGSTHVNRVFRPCHCSHSDLSQYDTAFAGDHTGTSSYPSPGSRDADDGSESPRETSAATESQPKPAAKRRRENRYKNAPPSVLSVSQQPFRTARAATPDTCTLHMLAAATPAASHALMFDATITLKLRRYKIK